MRWTLAYTLVGSALVICPARAAQPFPSIDSAAYCEKDAEHADNELLKRNCLSSEVTSELRLRHHWSETPEQVRANCVKSLAFVTPSYQALSTCVNGMMNLMENDDDATRDPR
jgi:hypothetical protein